MKIIKRNYIIILLLALILMPSKVFAQSLPPIELVINGNVIESDVAPFIENERTLVPIRVISEHLGYEVHWNQDDYIVTVTDAEYTDFDTIVFHRVLMLPINEKSAIEVHPDYYTLMFAAMIQGEDFNISEEDLYNYFSITELDVASTIKNDRTMVPIRFIAEQMGKYVEWNNETRTVIINDDPTAIRFEPNLEVFIGNTELEEKFAEAKVTNVVDGDTIDVTFPSGDVQRVRLILVDTPETVHPNRGVEFYGVEASNYTKSQLLNKTVYLEKDVSTTDKYGRYLYYVWLARPSTVNPTEEELFTKNFNSLLLENGYAHLASYPPDIKYADQFVTRQRIARDNSYGLWNEKYAIQFNSPKTETQVLSFAGNTSGADGTGGGNPNPTIYDNDPIAASYIANKNTGVFHRSSCSSVRRMSTKNMIPFNSAQNARNAGYRGCQRCKP